MKHPILVLIYTWAVPYAVLADSISGTVNGSDGSIITSGLVTAYQTMAATSLRPRSTPTSALVLPDGTFQFGALAEGTYTVCARAPLTAWLGSCEWGSPGSTVSLMQTKPSAVVRIVLTRGALIAVRVSDPTGLLTANEAKTPGGHLLVGVGMDSLVFLNAAIVSQDSAGRTYQVVVPFDRAVRISVASAFFGLSDVTGKALPKFGNVIPVLVPSGQPPPTVFLNVTGTIKP